MSIKNWLPFGGKKKQKQDKLVEEYTSLVKVYTPVNELTLGMYVVELDRPWLGSPFLFQGFEIKTVAELKTLNEVCEFVYIDMTRRKASKQPVVAPKDPNLQKLIANTAPPPSKLSVFEDEIIHSEKIYESTQVYIADLMESIAEGGRVDSKLAKEAVSECINSILKSPDAMLWLSQLKQKDQYTVQHSLNVSILSIVLGRHLNFSTTYLNIVGLCGLMHDMGKMLVPPNILNKPGRLDPEELQIMQTHTALGYELLKSSDGMNRNAVEVAYTHHEQMNSKGYPRHIGHADISHFSKIVAIADVYDAITSKKVYQDGRTHLEATGILTGLAGTQLDSQLVYKFIESIGVYPPGCLVELTNGAIAVVVEGNENLKLRPKIIIILDEYKEPVPEQVLDLSEMIADKRGDLYTIKSIVKAEDWKIDTTKYYEQEVLKNGFARSKKKRK